MEYIVKVCGEVVDNEYKAYAVKASSEEEAKKIAKKNFSEEFLTTGSIIVTERPLMRQKRSIFALVAMIIPILLSFVSWKNGHSTISISPDLISCLFGVTIYSAFVIRFKGIQRTVDSIYDILFAVVSAILFSTFIKILLFQTEISVLGIIKLSIDTNVILIVAVILSWLGLKIVSLSCIGIIVLLALGNIVGLNDAMGSIWGTIYIISSFLGIIMYASVEPAFLETRKSIYRFAKNSINRLNSDLLGAKQETSKIKSMIDNRKNDK